MVILELKYAITNIKKKKSQELTSRFELAEKSENLQIDRYYTIWKTEKIEWSKMDRDSAEFGTSLDATTYI